VPLAADRVIPAKPQRRAVERDRDAAANDDRRDVEESHDGLGRLRVAVEVRPRIGEAGEKIRGREDHRWWR
jgi:hypothetical protein